MLTITNNQIANIANIQKCCIHDGPGIRSVVFFMGCPLQCKWCQNPENLSKKSVIMSEQSKCMRCCSCIQACENNCLSLGAEGIEIDRSRCIGCGGCTNECLTDALTLCGESMSVEDVFEEVMKDEVFYRNSGGGVTVSGGEATLYPDFLLQLFQMLKYADIGTALETSGFCSEKTLRMLSEFVDVFLYDYKLHTEGLHEKWTGVSNRIIQRNLEFLSSIDCRIVIRIPLIPNINDGEEFVKMMDYLSTLPSIKEINLMPFHQVGSSKYKLTGIDYELEDFEECSDEIAGRCKLIAESYGFQVNIGGWDIKKNV